MRLQEKNIKLIALDLDGTLLNHESKISQVNQRAISEARSQGIHVIFSTGRPAEFCYPLMDLLELDGYVITTSGGEIWTTDMELIERNTFDPVQFEQLSKIGEKFNIGQWMISTEREFGNVEDIDNFADHDWLKIGYHSGSKEIIDEIKSKQGQHQELEITNSSPNNIEVNPKGVNKANAIKKVCQRLGITIDDVMAVGDSLNDALMIKQCGIGIAMGNAQEPIKEIADYITDTNENDGVAKAIEKFALKVSSEK